MTAYRSATNAPAPLRACRTDRWKARVAAVEADTYALYLACRDPRVPWLAKLVAVFVVAYALSPIDLIPDFLPVVGYLDDLLLLPLGFALAIRLIPPHVLAEHRARAGSFRSRPGLSWFGAIFVLAVWALTLGWFAALVCRIFCV